MVKCRRRSLDQVIGRIGSEAGDDAKVWIGKSVFTKQPGNGDPPLDRLLQKRFGWLFGVEGEAPCVFGKVFDEAE